MLRPRIDINLAGRAAGEVALRAATGQLFPRSVRTFRVPEGWCALASRPARDPVFAAAGQELAREGMDSVLFTRSTLFGCSLDVDDLRAADGFVCRGRIELSMRIPAEPEELSCLGRTLLADSDVLTAADIQKTLCLQMHGILAALAARHVAADLLRPVDDGAVAALVSEKLGAACLAAGLCVAGPAVVHFESPAWIRHCRQKAQLESQERRAEARTRIQAALATAREEHLGNLVRMLEQVRDASLQSGSAGMIELLKSLPEEERGEVYGALWHLCPTQRKTWRVAVVSGYELLLFEANDLSRPSIRIALPDTLGRLRSVSADERSIAEGLVMIGAACGVLLVDSRAGQVRQAWAYPGCTAREVRGGVNRAAMSDDRVFATHSELGVAAWPRAGGEGRMLWPELTRDVGTVRCAQVAEGRFWWAAGDTLYAAELSAPVAEPVRYRSAGAIVTDAVIHGGSTYVGYANGCIVAWQVEEPDSPTVLRGAATGPVESLQVVDGGGVERLIVADRSTAVIALVIGDGYVCRYESGSRIIRWTAAAHDVIVAVDDTRDLLMAWRPGRPEGPFTSVIMPHLTNGTIQDICIIPENASQEA